MVSLGSLWLAILVSAVLVFVASSLIHMMLKYHKTDFVKLSNENAVMDVLRPTPAGTYMVPHSGGGAAMKDPAFIERMKRGPIAIVSVLPPGVPNMGKNLSQWFVFIVLVSIFAAYVAGRARGPGAEYLDVFRFAATASFLGYAVGSIQESIWFGRKWSTTMKTMFDGLVYALLTGGAFGWLWPK